jgi:hypothetical protein
MKINKFGMISFINSLRVRFLFKVGFLFILPFVVSCAVLSESQHKNIKKLSVLGSDAAKCPSVMVEKMAQVRLERGLFYSSSLSSQESHIAELKSLAEAESEDMKLAEKFDAGIGFLNSYLYALRSLASDGRWEDYGVEMRSIGRSLSSSLEEINSLEWFDTELPSEISKAAAFSAASVAESYMKRRQMHFLRDFIERGDTLVGICVDSMVSVLRSERMVGLIENERCGLEDNYRIFLKTFPAGSVSFVYDRVFVLNLRRIDEVEKIRRSCISSLNAFKRAHSKVAKDVSKRRDGVEVYEELVELARQTGELLRIINK